MKQYQIALSDQIAKELDLLKKTGWFKDDNEIIQLALADFARLNRFALAPEIPCDELRQSAEAVRSSRAMTRA